MKLDQNTIKYINRFNVLLIVFLFFNGSIVNAQSVSRIQNLNFGSFISYGNGGTIIVSPNYTINKTGDIILKSNPSPAVFDLYVDAGKSVQLTYSNIVTLVGDHGGTISLSLTDSSPTGNGAFMTGSSPTRIVLGGTLTVGNPMVTPVGNYNGSFTVNITVNH